MHAVSPRSVILSGWSTKNFLELVLLSHSLPYVIISKIRIHEGKFLSKNKKQKTFFSRAYTVMLQTSSETICVQRGQVTLLQWLYYKGFKEIEADFRMYQHEMILRLYEVNKTRTEP